MSLLDHPHTRYEKRFHKEGYDVIVGVDEVGRGAWAGPIIAGAVAMPLRPRIYGIRDSKQLSKKKREELAKRIKEIAVAWAIGIVSHSEIDAIGIGPANALAMKKSVELLPVEADYVLLDAFNIVGLQAKQSAIANGDAMVYSIAAASIVAKVMRDDIMTEYHEQHPEYSFNTNMGYGTEAHQHALDAYGLTPIHRTSFHPMKTMV